jgi:hypothetical protein
MNLKIIQFEDVGWVYLAQDRVQSQALVNTVMDFRVQKNVKVKLSL